MREIGAGFQLGVFAALLVLTTATLLLSFASLGPFHAPVAMAIAAAKGALIVFFFMHLVEQSRVNGLVLLASLLLLAAFIGLSATDVETRRGAEPARAAPSVDAGSGSGDPASGHPGSPAGPTGARQDSPARMAAPTYTVARMAKM